MKNIIKEMTNMDKTATKLINWYKGQTDGFPHVKESRWEDNHLIVWLDHDYINELCAILPYSYFDRQRVAIIRWDKQYKEWRLEDQPPFDGCLRNTLGEHVINVLPWITSAGYKVTEQRIIDMYH